MRHMSSRPVVHLHIGAPKTGTTYLQDRLTVNHHGLRQAAQLAGLVDAMSDAADEDVMAVR